MNSRSSSLFSSTSNLLRNENESSSQRSLRLSDLLGLEHSSSAVNYLSNNALINESTRDLYSSSQLRTQAHLLPLCNLILQNLNSSLPQDYSQLHSDSRREILDLLESLMRIRRLTQNSLNSIMSGLLRDYIQMSLLDRALSEESKPNQGLSTDEIEKIEVDEFIDRSHGVARIKNRNGIHKKSNEKLKKSLKTNLLEEEAEPTSSSTCAICLEDYRHGEKLRKFACSHKFHKDCADQWLTYKNFCPVCKGKPIRELINQAALLPSENSMGDSLVQGSTPRPMSSLSSSNLISEARNPRTLPSSEVIVIEDDILDDQNPINNT